MSDEFTQAELEAYLDESLDVERMAQIEKVIRGQPKLLERLARINARRESGIHTLGEIWRRNQVGVPTREELNRFALGTLPAPHADYIRFRIQTLRCRYTIANLRDMQTQREESGRQVTARRRKYFQSSVDHLKE